MAVAPLVWINGFPGSGKLTIAGKVVNLFDEDKILLIDNHQLIDPVEARFPRHHPQYQSERHSQRSTCFGDVVHAKSMLSRTIIFTGEDST